MQNARYVRVKEVRKHFFDITMDELIGQTQDVVGGFAEYSR